MDLENLKKYFDENQECSICGKLRYFFEMCVFCKNNDFIKELKKLAFDENNAIIGKLKKIKCEIIAKEKANNNYIKKFNESSMKICLMNAFTTCPDNIKKNMVIFLQIYLDKTKSNIEKSKNYIELNYRKLFDCEHYDVAQNCPSASTEEIKTYIASVIKREHIKTSLMYLTHMIRCKNTDFTHMKHYQHKSTYEIKFMYNIYYNDQLLSKIKWFICEHKTPMIANYGHMRIDFLFVFDLNGSARFVHLEIDDYYDYEKLLGGHGTPKRIIRDVLKDVYCWMCCNSLIRITNKEDAIDALNTYITNAKSFPVYRFYKNYFNNKMDVSTIDTFIQKEQSVAELQKTAMTDKQCEEYFIKKRERDEQAKKRLQLLIASCCSDTE